MTDSICLRFLAAPTDVAADGKSVQAGRVMEWIDRAGYALAVGHATSYCVTAYVGNVHFSRPIRPGSLVEAEARLLHTGRSSMHVLVTVDFADPRDGVFTRATHCILVFVAVDGEGKPRAVPQWQPADDEGRELEVAATERIAARRDIHEAMRAQQYTEAGTGPREVFRFLSAPTDANWGGNAHGGIVMRWIDEVANACATRWAGSPTVAVYSGGIHFYRPVRIGHVVELEARLIHTGERSMHAAIHVRSGPPTSEERTLTTQCMSVLVARGPDSRALGVPSLPLATGEDIALDAHARDLVARRAALPRLPVDVRPPG